MKTRRIISVLLFALVVFVVAGCSKPDDGGGNDVNDNNDNYNDVIAPTGAINGLFSVDASRKVWFSKGNLQYKALTNTWRFAGNQWDYVGRDDFGTVYGSSNHLISSTYDGWIDLFGWGTSGYNRKYPYMTSENNDDYGNGYNSISGTRYDWGVYNAISNGGNMAGIWRTLTIEEWRYILYDRNTNSGIRYAMSHVNGVDGIIMLPDDWKASTFALNHANENTQCTNNTIDESTWKNVLEPAGVVFLPAACMRCGTKVYSAIVSGTHVQSFGYYWSSSNIAYSSSTDETVAAHISIVTLKYMDDYQTHVGWTESDRYAGLSIRLVSDCK